MKLVTQYQDPSSTFARVVYHGGEGKYLLWGTIVKNGGLVPGNDDYIIHEQSQASIQVVKQVVNGTRVPFVGVTPGSDDATGGSVGSEKGKVVET